jgi:hypothetical protein
MCNCKGTAKPDPQPQIQVQQITPPVIDELPFPDTPDGLMAQELKKWKDEQHQIMMDDLNKTQPD